jgi:hypothetical protein
MAATGKAEVRALMLRLPKSLHRLLAQGAKKADRSLNAEIVWRLRLSFDLEGELAEAKRRLLEQDALKQAQEHLREIKKFHEGLATTTTFFHTPSKGSEK